MTTFKRDNRNPHPAKDVAYLWEQVEKRGWDPVGAFALIRGESGWDPSIRNSIGATGLIQVTDGSARSQWLFPEYGFSDARPIAKMGFREQVEKIVLPYWDKTSKGTKYKGPISFFIWGLGAEQLGGAKDAADGSRILYRAGTPGAKNNKALCNRVTGNMTEKSVEEYWAGPLIRAVQNSPDETYNGETSSSSSEEEKKKCSPLSVSCPHCGNRLMVFLEEE